RHPRSLLPRGPCCACPAASPPALRPFPTRRSSDLPAPGHVAGLPGVALLEAVDAGQCLLVRAAGGSWAAVPQVERFGSDLEPPADRKSTRLNSSHRKRSYAVLCLEKKKQSRQQSPP